MKNIIIIFLITLLTNAQSFFPLEVGNEWDFECSNSYSDSKIDTFVVKVEGDTLMMNGYYYYELNSTLFFGAKYFRVDSNYICVYDDKGNKDIKLIDLFAELNESRTVEYKSINSVKLIYVDSSKIFDYQSTIKVFRLDGIMVRYIALSSKFGPFSMWTPGEPPGLILDHEYLIGCIISNTSYGNVVSVEVSNQIQKKVSLSQNYPNPFNPSTIIKFNIPNVETTRRVVSTKLTVYDVLGREVKTLLNKNLSPGNYEITFDGSDLTSGVYFYVLEVGEERLSRKMLLIK